MPVGALFLDKSGTPPIVPDALTLSGRCDPCYNLDTMANFQEVEHTADLALRVQGCDLGDLFVNAAQGMSSLLDPEGAAAPGGETRRCEIEAFDAESLLVEWLSELVYWAEVDRFVCSAFQVQHASPTRLAVVCRGSRLREMQRHIKAVTYHNLAIVPTEQGLEATVVFDV